MRRPPSCKQNSMQSPAPLESGFPLSIRPTDSGAVVSGSHTDAIPLAGMYDGTLGVIGAIAALKALTDVGFKPRRPIDAMMFTSEEPTRFGLGCIGRQVHQDRVSCSKSCVLDMKVKGCVINNCKQLLDP